MLHNAIVVIDPNAQAFLGRREFINRIKRNEVLGRRTRTNPSVFKHFGAVGFLLRGIRFTKQCHDILTIRLGIHNLLSNLLRVQIAKSIIPGSAASKNGHSSNGRKNYANLHEKVPLV